MGLLEVVWVIEKVIEKVTGQCYYSGTLRVQLRGEYDENWRPGSDFNHAESVYYPLDIQHLRGFQNHVQ